MITTSTSTQFRRWRTELGLTQDEAAEKLRVSASQVKNWDAGIDRASGRPSAPPYAIRVVMQLLAEHGDEPEAWPAGDDR